MDLPEGKAVLQFTASWCGPCRMLKPRIEKIMADVDTPWLLVDVDDEPEMRDKFGVMSIPTVILLEDGSEVGRHIGAPAADAVQKFVA